MSYYHLDDESPKIGQPDGVIIELMEHQKTIVSAMTQIESDGYIEANGIDQYRRKMDFYINTNLGILADRVGAGKSLMVVSLITLKRFPKLTNTCWVGSKHLSIKVKNDYHLNCNLVIVPHKIFSQWVDFFSLSPNLKVGCYSNTRDEKEIKGPADILGLDVLIVSCAKYKSFLNKFGQERWARIFVDEADTISLPKETELNSSFVWLITATPKKLRYSTKPYLITVFRDIVPWAFNYLQVKNDPDFIDKSIVLPAPRRFVIRCHTPREVQFVKNFISSNALSMINAGNIDDAVKALDCNVGNSKNILQAVTSRIKETLDNKVIELDSESKKTFKTDSLAEAERHQKVKRLEKVVDRLRTRYDSIKELIYNLNDQYCPICMDEFEKPTLVNCCQNVFCFECITLASSESQKCPFCRKRMHKENFFVIEDEKEIKEQKNSMAEKDQKKDKMEVLTKIIRSKPDGKFMIFANFTQTFKKIEKELLSMGVNYKILKGQNKKIAKAIQDFEKGEISVIMLNAKYFGAGMNLQMATDLVIYHRFDKELEEQVIGRAQRLGRTCKLNIYYLLHSNESDEFDDFSSGTNFYRDITDSVDNLSEVHVSQMEGSVQKDELKESEEVKDLDDLNELDELDEQSINHLIEGL